VSEFDHGHGPLRSSSYVFGCQSDD